MLFQTGLMNVDFATLRRAFVHRGGKTLFGTGYAKGPDYLQRAIQDLELCPLLHLPENKYVRRTDSLIVNVVGGPDLTMSQVQAVIDYVTEKFGKRDNLVLGAVIDGAMAQSLRITVIGGTDVAGAAKQHKPAPSASIPANVSPAASRKAEAGARFPEGRRRRARDLQDEFDFPDACEQRGYFEKTASNICDGEDLDIPTYFRRGVRIALH
jgi:cell division protein FtsZ